MTFGESSGVIVPSGSSVLMNVTESLLLLTTAAQLLSGVILIIDGCSATAMSQEVYGGSASTTVTVPVLAMPRASITTGVPSEGAVASPSTAGLPPQFATKTRSGRPFCAFETASPSGATPLGCHV